MLTIGSLDPLRVKLVGISLTDFSAGTGLFLFWPQLHLKELLAMNAIIIREATEEDKGAIWSIIEPIVRKGETYALDTDMTYDDAINYWFLSNHEVFVAVDGSSEGSEILGTYFLCNNQKGNGKHIANCGYMVSQSAQGRGVANTMCVHSLTRAKEADYKGMQYNYVVSSNHRAVKLWQKNGLHIAGTLPKAFNHPTLGYVDVFVMFKEL